jgi:glycopeptide antibiotics resistance protein
MKNVFFVGAIISLILCVLVGEVYRPWAFSNDIDDFGIASSGVSFMGTISVAFFLCYTDGHVRLRTMLSVMLGCTIYEILQPFLGLGIYDTNDIIAVFLGVLVAAFILNIISRLYSENKFKF